MNTLEIKNIQNVFILGATGAIGHSIASELLQRNLNLNVYSLSRHDTLNDLNNNDRFFNHIVSNINENEIKSYLDSLGKIKFDLIINTIGYLDTDSYNPEKSLKDISDEKLSYDFYVNSIISVVLAKVTQNFLASHFGFIVLSAMVGSIEENQSGGWYGYRASKAALNMFIKNISIEWKRKYKNSLVLAIHPGTTKTKLSEKYIKNIKHKLHTPEESAVNILNIVFNTPFEMSGAFINWDKRKILW